MKTFTAQSAVRATTILVVLICCCRFTLGSIPVSDFYSYGLSEGDSRLANVLDVYFNVTFSPEGTTFPFFSESYEGLWLGTSGILTFDYGSFNFFPKCASMDQPMIFPFWADIDINKGGYVFYRQTSDNALRAKAKSDSELQVNAGNFNIDWLFIVTWEEVAFYGAANPSANCEGRNLRNSYQAVLAADADGVRSYAIFYYNKIQWTTGTMPGADGSPCTGLGAEPAKAGFDFGDGERLYTITGSCTNNIVQLPDTSNVGVPGKWVFQIDDYEELPPLPTAEPTTEENEVPSTTQVTTEETDSPSTTQATTTTNPTSVSSTTVQAEASTTEGVKPCLVDCSTGQIYYVNPESCNSFYQCSNGVPYFQPCPAGLVFNPNINVCDWPSSYACQDPPGC